tara:strand:- start:200 stop:376 length:177 start_codon:yes stop_codon:yes gene_type:complete
MANEKKDRPWDGRSRPSDNLYRKRFEEIFGKKIDNEKEELEGYYIDEKGIKVLTKKKR